MKKKKYLPIFYQFLKNGKIPQHGLCNCMPDDELLKLFTPTATEFYGHPGDESLVILCYWGFDGLPAGCKSGRERVESFSPMRQNILLLMAAINGEL